MCNCTTECTTCSCKIRFDPADYGMIEATYMQRVEFAARGVDPIELNGRFYFMTEEHASMKSDDALNVKGNIAYMEF